MDKKIAILLLCLLVTVASVALFYININIHIRNRVYNVNTGLTYAEIQRAIDAPETKNGNTIIIYSGIYHENVEVTKKLTIKGQDRDSTIIERGHKSVIILLIKADNTTVANLTVQGSTFGIWCLNTTGCKIVGNKVSNCTTAIRLDFSSTTTVKDNNVTVCSLRGIHLYESFNNTVANNDIENIIAQAYGAIHLESSNSNVVVLNQLVNSTWGIWIDFSSNNKIYHNNFIDNTNQVYSGFSNIWNDDYPSGGNYWSDYIGVDQKSGPYQNITGTDGIGDTAYIIDEQTKDQYPLMEPI
jgi:parallel beta-helix repeat protein